MATRFRSPVFAELAIYLAPKAGARPVKVRARKGYFDIEPSMLKAFKKYAADRPQYAITEVGETIEGPDLNPEPVGVTKAQRDGEMVAEVTLAEATEKMDEAEAEDEAIEAADEAADEEEDVEDDEDDED